MKIFTAVIIVWLMTITNVFSQLQEPTMPRVDQQFSVEKERRIDELENLDLKTAFSVLALPEFSDDDEYLNKAAYRTFNSRSEEAIGFAIRFVQSPQSVASEEGMKNLYMAKKILQIFPDESLDPLLNLYNIAGPKVRANVIYVMGQMSGAQVPATLLTEALYDKSICQELTGESVGWPMRICDMAYNQLVLRYSIENVPRTIGTGHSMDERDHHIRILQSKLK